MRMNVAKEIVKIINGEAAPSKPRPFDARGIVKRVEGKTAYVRINGSKTETPVQMTIACEPGDEVQVRESNHTAWLVGNHSAPPTDDKVAKEAKRIAQNAEKKVEENAEMLQEEMEDLADKQFTGSGMQYARSSSASQFIATTTWSEALPAYVSGQYYWQRTVTYYADGSVAYGDPVYAYIAQASAEADVAADNAQAAADEAGRIAQNALDGVSEVEQHFWHDSTGAHIAENAGDLSTGASQTIASTGTVMMRNGKLVTSWTGSSSSDAALNFYDCSNASAETGDLVASYARSGATFYVQNKRTMALTSSGMTLYDPADQTDPMAVYSNGGIQLGKQGTSADGKYNLAIKPSAGMEFYYYDQLIGMISQYVNSDGTVKALRLSNDNGFTNRIMIGKGDISINATDPTSGRSAYYAVDPNASTGGHTWSLSPGGLGRQMTYTYNSSTQKVNYTVAADTATFNVTSLKQNGNKVLTAANMESGRTGEYTANGGNYKDVTVYHSLGATPNVVGTLYKTSTDQAVGLMSIVVAERNSSYVTFRVFNRDTTNRPFRIDWIAMVN